MVLQLPGAVHAFSESGGAFVDAGSAPGATAQLLGSAEVQRGGVRLPPAGAPGVCLPQLVIGAPAAVAQPSITLTGWFFPQTPGSTLQGATSLASYGDGYTSFPLWSIGGTVGGASCATGASTYARLEASVSFYQPQYCYSQPCANADLCLASGYWSTCVGPNLAVGNGPLGWLHVAVVLPMSGGFPTLYARGALLQTWYLSTVMPPLTQPLSSAFLGQTMDGYTNFAGYIAAFQACYPIPHS